MSNAEELLNREYSFGAIKSFQNGKDCQLCGGKKTVSANRSNYYFEFEIKNYIFKCSYCGILYYFFKENNQVFHTLRCFKMMRNDYYSVFYKLIDDVYYSIWSLPQKKYIIENVKVNEELTSEIMNKITDKYNNLLILA